MSARTSFHLVKWYIDAIGDDGCAIIAYHAVARIGGVRIGYASVMGREPGSAVVKTRTSLRAGPPPLERPDGVIEWGSAAIGLELSCSPRSSPIGGTLLEGEQGRIEWEAKIPSGEIAVKCGEGRWIGRGYVERMEMTVPPWHLPIDRLRWGRWLTKDAWAVWIRWEGAEERDLLWDEQGAAGRPEIDDERLSWIGRAGSHRTLVLDRGMTIRDGELGRTVLDAIPGVRKLTPGALGRVLGVRETKWLSGGARTSGGAGAETGWAIHEVVMFPKGMK